MKGYTVSRLGELVGASPDTLRYYERIGLLPEPERSPAGYRLYGDDAVARMRFIKAAQRLGISLEGIGELLAIRERGLCPCGHTRVLLEGKLNQIDAELDALSELRGEIQRMLEERPSSPWRTRSARTTPAAPSTSN